MKREREACRVIKAAQFDAHLFSDRQFGVKQELRADSLSRMMFYWETAMALYTQITDLQTVIKTGEDQGQPTMNTNIGGF